MKAQKQQRESVFILTVLFSFSSQSMYAVQANTTSTSAVSLMFFFAIILIVVIAGLYIFFGKNKKVAVNEAEELRKEKEEYEKTIEELNRKSKELETTVSTLTSSKRELEQILVAKIKENDAIMREAVEKEERAKVVVQEAETIQDSVFVETIHEMRTPLSLVLGSLSLIVQNKTSKEDMPTQLISAYRNTLSLQDLADQLIDIRRTNDISNYLRVARYDIVDIAQQTCDLFVDWIAMNNVDFSFKTESDVMWVWLDRRKIEYAMRTLLSNALKNTFVYGKVSLEIEAEQKGENGYCKITVQDEGLDENENTRRGLRQIMDMIEEIGGIYEHDTSANGTYYTLYLPLGKQHLMERRVEFIEPEGDLVKLNDKQKEEISELIQVIPQKKSTGKKLLVIDDSDQIRWFLKHVFSKEYQIVEARDGGEGVKMALQEQPDLILCDVMMPVKDGFEACKEIKSNSRTSQIPVVMLTAKVESEDVIKGIEAGADDYITKPFDVEILRSKVGSLLKKREQLKHYYTRSVIMSSDIGSLPKEEEEPIKNLTTTPFMEAVINTIEEHIDDPKFEAKVVAESLNMSLPTLYRKIKQHSDCSILELTRTVRLKRAGELLLTQKYSVQEVAEKVGFNDTATFRKRFTEQYGVTPSQYGQPMG